MRSPGPRTVEAADSVSPRVDDPYRVWKHAGLLLLAVVWIALGLTGHDPW